MVFCDNAGAYMISHLQQKNALALATDQGDPSPGNQPFKI